MAAIGKVVRQRLGEGARVGRPDGRGLDRGRPVKRQLLLLLLLLLLGVKRLDGGRQLAEGKAATNRAGRDPLAKLDLLLAEVSRRLVGRVAKRGLLLLRVVVAGVS